MSWYARFRALPGGQQVAILATAVVAIGAGLLSWDANTWAAGEIGIDPQFRWIYGVVIDGAIAAGTAGVFVLAGARSLGAWCVMLSALAVSLLGNAAHAHPGSWLHTAGSTVPALLLAACLFVLELIARAPARASDRIPSPRARRAPPRSASAPQARIARPKVLIEGRYVSVGHARKLRAAARRAEQEAPRAA